jgi:hypothetical protein
VDNLPFARDASGQNFDPVDNDGFGKADREHLVGDAGFRAELGIDGDLDQVTLRQQQYGWRGGGFAGGIGRGRRGLGESLHCDRRSLSGRQSVSNNRLQKQDENG